MSLSMVAVANLLVACSSGDAQTGETTHQSPEASVRSPSTGTSSSPAVNLSGVTKLPPHASKPERAATSYMAMLMAGDYDGAATWVIPSQQGILQAIALGSGDDSPPGISGQVEVGSVESTREDSATVTFVGKMCREVPASEDQLAKDCVVNRDPRSKDPTFVVHLIDTGDAGWKVLFQAPEG